MLLLFLKYKNNNCQDLLRPFLFLFKIDPLTDGQFKGVQSRYGCYKAGCLGYNFLLRKIGGKRVGRKIRSQDCRAEMAEILAG